MVSVRTAPRPADFRPNIWPANWKLWRQDRFDTPGTIYDPALWLRMNHGNAAGDHPNIIPTPDGPGVRFIADVFDDGGTPRARSACIFSGPGLLSGYYHSIYADGVNSLGQVYTPPFMVTFWERYSPANSMTSGVQGTWIINPGFPTRMGHYGIDVAAIGDAPTDARLYTELDGSELFIQDNMRHTQAMYNIAGDWETQGHNNVASGGVPAPVYNGTDPNEWYQVSYLVYREPDGLMRVMSQLRTSRRSVIWQDFVGVDRPHRVPYYEALFEKMPFCVFTGNWATSGWFALAGSTPGGPVGASRWFDLRDFRVYLPPEDPRLLQDFRSNSPGAPAEVPPFWEVAAEIVGTTVNVTITDGQPRANWSVSVSEDDPAPPPPVTASGTITWITGTKDYNVPGIDISSLDPAKNLGVAVTHGGRSWSVVVKR